MYVHSNLRLLVHKQNDYKEEETKMWNIEPKHTNLDASTSQHATFGKELDSEHMFTVSASGTTCFYSNLPTSFNVNDHDYLFEEPYDVDC